jgi:hypothetical protein
MGIMKMIYLHQNLFIVKQNIDGEKELIKNSNKYTIIRISNLHSHDLAFKTNILSKIITNLKKGAMLLSREGN